MATGHAYDSEGGRALAAAITSLMTGTAYSARRSWPGSSARTTATRATPSRTSGSCASTPPPASRSARVGTSSARSSTGATKAWQDCLALGETNG